MASPKKVDTTNKYIRLKFYYIDYKSPHKIHPPSLLTTVIPVQSDINATSWTPTNTKNDTIKIKIHPRNYLAFTIGLNGSILNYQSFKLNSDTLSVNKIDSSHLSGNISMALEFYPFGGRDIDELEPIWKHWNQAYQRIGFTAAISLAKDPLQSYYLGITYSLSRDFSIVGGWNWINTVTNGQTYDVTKISSLTDVENFFLGRKYTPNLYFGIALSPSEAMKDLGLGKSK